MDDTTVENAATPGAPAVGLGLRLAPAGDEAQPPSTPPPGQRSAAPAVVLEIEAQTTPEDKDRFSGLAELRTPPHARGHLGDSPSGLLAVDAFPRPPQSPRSPRSPLRDHTPIHAHESHEHVAVVLPEEDLMVPAVIVDPADPIQPHPVATDTAFFHEIHEDPIQTANPTSPFPRSPRRSPLSSPQRHRSPISSPGPGHSPSPTSKIAWKIHNHHLLVGDREQQQQAHSAIISPTQLEAGLTELLARTSLGPHADEDEHRVSGKPHQLAECGTPDSETTNVVDGFSHSLSRTDTLEVLKVEPVKKDSGIDLVEEEEEKPSLVSPPAVNEQKQHIPRFFFGSHDEIQSAMSDDLKKRWAERNQEAQVIIFVSNLLRLNGSEPLETL